MGALFTLCPLLFWDRTTFLTLNGQQVLLEVDAWTLSGQIVLKNTQKTIVSFLFFVVAVKYIVP